MSDNAEKQKRIKALDKLYEKAREQAIYNLEQANRILSISKHFTIKSLELLAEKKKLEQEILDGR